MRKIPTLLARTYPELPPGKRRREPLYVSDEITPGCEWALTTGIPRRKWDGTAVCVTSASDSVPYGPCWYFVRRQVKQGQMDPPGFILAEADPVTGNRFGWTPADLESDAGRWLAEALSNYDGVPQPGTYELVGPKINGNPDKLAEHRLIAHASAEIAPWWIECIGLRNHSELRVVDLHALMRSVAQLGWEGVVFYDFTAFWGPDPHMAKLKVKDLRPEILA